MTMKPASDTTHELYKFTKAVVGGSKATARATKLSDGSSPHRVIDLNNPNPARAAAFDSKLSSTDKLYTGQEDRVRASVLSIPTTKLWLHRRAEDSTYKLV